MGYFFTDPQIPEGSTSFDADHRSRGRLQPGPQLPGHLRAGPLDGRSRREAGHPGRRLARE
eukprot:1419479-Alexandrium_andersonii.AAC.1